MTTSTAGRIPLEELARLPSIFLPSVNYQGDRAAFYSNASGSLELYLVDLRTGEQRQISSGGLPKSLKTGFVWNHAGDRIAFARDSDGDERHDLVAMDVATGDLTNLTNDPECQEYPLEFSPDDRFLLVLTDKKAQLNLWRMRSDGSEYQQLTNYESPVLNALWSPDGGRIAYITNESADLRNVDGYVMNANGSGRRRVFHVAEGSQDRIIDWASDGVTLAVSSDAAGLDRAGLLNVETGELRWLGKDGVDEHAVCFSQDGRQLLCVRNRESQTELVIYETTTGEPRELKLQPSIVSAAEFVLEDTALLIAATTPTSRASLDLYSLTDDGVMTLVPAQYGSIDPSLFVDCDHIWYDSYDGTRIPALLYRPRDAPSPEGRAAIVIIHGGPTLQFLRGWDPFAQFLVNRGYVVLEPNPRGSTGYGVEFRDAALLDWGGVDLEDIAAGAEYVKRLPDVNTERLAVFGTSYGGFMAYLIAVKKPDLFQVAVSRMGISDLRRLYDSAMPHFQYMLRQQMGDPDERAEIWRDRSTANFLEHLRAKLLIMHGVNDPRCPIEQAQIVRNRLQALGRREGADFEYVELTDEGHGSTDLDQQLRTYRLLADFLDRHL